MHLVNKRKKESPVTNRFVTGLDGRHKGQLPSICVPEMSVGSAGSKVLPPRVAIRNSRRWHVALNALDTRRESPFGNACRNRQGHLTAPAQGVQVVSSMIANDLIEAVWNGLEKCDTDVSRGLRINP
ncbi:hypothetical protein [Acidovorax sp. Leaf160]|uniref:hypothetical protein n=1 Tax=Acidovorax sp. Leaf160 TaxID=1736280 RepID=UPI0012E3352E|nr:hypothetical protein [Acidovorax sp. Leaf160]